MAEQLGPYTELVQHRLVGKTRKASHAHQGLVPVKVRRQRYLALESDRRDRRLLGVDAQADHTVEELEADPAPGERLVQRANTTSPIPARIFQKMAPR
jgi:hypothetical protein